MVARTLANNSIYEFSVLNSLRPLVHGLTVSSIAIGRQRRWIPLPGRNWTITNLCIRLCRTQVAYLYTKVRSEFGKHCSFKDVPAFLLETVPCSTEYDENYVARNPSIAELDTSPHMSGEVNDRLLPKWLGPCVLNSIFLLQSNGTHYP